MFTILYEGTPVRPDGGIFWQIVERYKPSVMFSAPTAVRVLKKQDPAGSCFLSTRTAVGAENITEGLYRSTICQKIPPSGRTGVPS